MSIATVVAQRSTCSRAHVGAVISRDGRIITTGYNGAPSGLPHCDHTHEERPLHYILPEVDSKKWAIQPGRIMEMPETTITIGDTGCQIAEHAERNAIAFAARYGLALEGAEIHCTHAPCLQCARSIINAGIKKVTYEIPYRLTEGVELLKTAGIKVDSFDAEIADV